MKNRYLLVVIGLALPLIVNAAEVKSKVAAYEKMGKNTQADELLLVSAAHGDIRGIKIALGQGANINAGGDYGRTALMLAALSGQNKALEFLLNIKGIDINAADSDGQTALILAVGLNRHLSNPRGAEILLQHGANAKLKNNIGWTAMDYAKKNRNKELVNMLTNFGG